MVEVVVVVWLMCLAASHVRTPALVCLCPGCCLDKLIIENARTGYHAAIESKIARYRAALADVQPLTNRRTNFLRIVGPHIECRGWPTFATFAMAPTGVVVAGSQTRVVQQQI